MVPDYGRSRPETPNPRIPRGGTLRKYLEAEGRTTDKGRNPCPGRTGRCAMIELDRESWNKGFKDGKAGKREPDGVFDKLAYESGYVEGVAEEQAEEEDEPSPKL